MRLLDLEFIINEDKTVTAKTDVFVNKPITKLPIKFKQTKSFYCANNNLTTLEGCPEQIHGSFYCQGNFNLLNLNHFPKLITETCYITATNHTIKTRLNVFNCGAFVTAFDYISYNQKFLF